MEYKSNPHDQAAIDAPRLITVQLEPADGRALLPKPVRYTNPRMKFSSNRILTSHVGSLPRSQTVVDLLFKREHGEPFDQSEFDRVMAQAVSDTVQRQVEIGHRHRQ
jgi:Methionine synthase II (cobalamin-independent)